MSETNTPILSVILPSHDNGTIVPRTVQAIRAICPPTTEIIVVDDGNTDETSAMLQTLSTQDPLVRIVHHAQCLGKGAAVRDGVMAAQGQYIGFTDADLDIDATNLATFLTILTQDQTVDGVIGYRTRYHTSFFRHCTHSAYHWIVRLLFGIPFRDTQTAMKLFRRQHAKNLFSSLQTQGYAFDVELLTRAFEQHLNIQEVAVQQDATGSSMTLRKMLGMIGTTLILYRQYVPELSMIGHWYRLRRWMTNILSTMLSGLEITTRWITGIRPEQ